MIILIKNALKRGDFSRAKEKIDDNLLLLHANVKELQEYLFKIGSKKDNQALVDKRYFIFFALFSLYLSIKYFYYILIRHNDNPILKFFISDN